MKLTIQRGDLTVTVEGEDALQVLQHLGIAPLYHATSRASAAAIVGAGVRPHDAGAGGVGPDQATPPADHSHVDDVDAKKFRHLYSTLGRTPRLVLTTLYGFPDGVTDVELKAALTTHNITTLAGAMTAIVKGTRRLKIDTEKVIEKETFRNKETGSYFRYRIGSVAATGIADMKLQEAARNGRGAVGAAN